MNKKTIIQRLAFVKYLIHRGNTEATNSEPLSSIALLHYHNALELVFDLILEDKGINTNNLSFMQYFDKINKWLKDNGKTEISLRPSLVKLKDRRVNLKHKGLFPSKIDIEESKFTANNIFEELCKSVYDLNADEISLIELIENKRVKKLIKEAKQLYDTDQRGSIEKISISFEYLLEDYEKSKRNSFFGSPFNFGKDMTIWNSLLTEKELTGNKMKKFVDTVIESIRSIQEAVKILAFGLDYKKYSKFRLLIPEPFRYREGNKPPMVLLEPDVKISKEDLDFCINYLIECSLKLQEFDFEISKYEKR